jgi:membrane protease YdiL (CAAX protease family)
MNPVGSASERVVVVNSTLNDSSVRFSPDVLASIKPPHDELAAPPEKVERPTPSFWGALGWVVVWIFVCGIVPFFFAGLYASLTGQPITPFLEPAMLAGQTMGVALAVFLLVRKLGRRWVAEVGLNRLPAVPTVLAILSVPGLKVALSLVVALFVLAFGADDPMKKVVMDSASSVPWWLLVLVLAVGPALNEELWFRGYLGRGLVGRYGPAVGVVLASLLFGLAHLSLVQGTYAAILGLWLHLAYRATRSLWIPILVHFLNNGISAAFGIVVASGAVTPAEPGPHDQAISLVVSVAALAVTATASWGLYRLRVREPQQAK